MTQSKIDTLPLVHEATTDIIPHIADTAGGTGTVTSITATSPVVVTPSPITATGVVSHANSGVTATTYGDSGNVPQITVNATGHVTAVTNVAFDGSGWMWGGGADGVVNFDGTNTYATFATTTGAAPNLVYTLSSSILATTLTIAAGKTVNAANFQLFCTGTTTINGDLNAAGSNNSANKGTQQPGAGNGLNGRYQPGTASGTGGTGALAPTNGTTSGTAGCVGGAGGSGGASSTPQAGGTGGSASVAVFASLGRIGIIGHTLYAVLGNIAGTGGGNPIVFAGGTGGGGGGGVTGVTVGGGGGSGAGVVGLFSRYVAGSGTITATGGDGNRGDWQAPAGGGGGGGGGGCIFVVTTTGSWQSLLTASVAGGNGGATTGGGAAGSNGATGRIVSIIMNV